MTDIRSTGQEKDRREDPQCQEALQQALIEMVKNQKSKWNANQSRQRQPQHQSPLSVVTTIKGLKARTTQTEESGNDDGIVRVDGQNHERNGKKGETKAHDVLHHCRDTDC